MNWPLAAAAHEALCMHAETVYPHELALLEGPPAKITAGLASAALAAAAVFGGPPLAIDGTPAAAASETLRMVHLAFATHDLTLDRKPALCAELWRMRELMTRRAKRSGTIFDKLTFDRLPAGYTREALFVVSALLCCEISPPDDLPACNALWIVCITT